MRRSGKYADTVTTAGRPGTWNSVAWMHLLQVGEKGRLVHHRVRPQPHMLGVARRPPKAATKPPVRCDVTAGTDLRDRDVDISSQPKLSIDAK